MKTATIGIRDLMAIQKRQEHFAQTIPAAISPERSAKRTFTERRGHEEWKRRYEEDWQSHLQALQHCVCELLHKNQQLGMALMAANEPGRGYRGAINS